MKDRRDKFLAQPELVIKLEKIDQSPFSNVGNFEKKSDRFNRVIPGYNVPKFQSISVNTSKIDEPNI